MPSDFFLFGGRGDSGGLNKITSVFAFFFKFCIYYPCFNVMFRSLNYTFRMIGDSKILTVVLRYNATIFIGAAKRLLWCTAVPRVF